MSNISKININGVLYDIRDAAAQSYLATLRGDVNTEGSVLTFVWIEEDPNGTYDVGAEVKYEHKLAGGTLTGGVNGSYHGEFEDKEIGRGHMCWWDSYNTLFDQGIRFRLGNL